MAERAQGRIDLVNVVHPRAIGPLPQVQATAALDAHPKVAARHEPPRRHELAGRLERPELGRRDGEVARCHGYAVAALILSLIISLTLSGSAWNSGLAITESNAEREIVITLPLRETPLEAE